jgi:AcrR family transcriptional regulator
VADPLTRARIVEATRRMIEASGLEAVSLRRGAQALGVTAPALYAYVADKQDLLRGVAEVEFDQLMQRFLAVDADDPIGRIRGLCRAYVDHALTSPALFRTMFLFPPELANSSSTGHELPAATKAFDTALTASTAAVDAGLFPRVDPLTAALVTWTAMHGLADILLLGFAFDDATADRLISTVIDTTIAGLRAG